jgi:hypothetical protein
LAVANSIDISAEDFRTLNRCLDDAIAESVVGFATEERAVADSDAVHLRNLIYTAVTAFAILREGRVAVSGSTGDLVHRSLEALNLRIHSRPL